MLRNQLQSECDGCHSEEKWILHNIRHRGIFRRFCTSCVLKFNPDSFCCVCYQVFHLSHTIPCSKCPSLAHLHCVAVDDNNSPNPFLCPPCSDPNFSYYSFFDSSSISNKNVRFSDVAELRVAGNQQEKIIDAKFAKLLVAASWIASVSMRKAATAKRMDAECRLKDAAFAQKAALESLDLLASTILSKTKKGFTMDNEVEMIRAPDPEKPAVAKPQEQLMMKKNKKNKNKKKSKAIASIVGANPVILSIANKKTKKKKKKTKKTKTIGATDASQNGLYKQAKSYRNSRPRYADGPSINVGDCGNSSTTSDNMPKAVHGDPNNNAFFENGDKSELQNYAAVNGNKCGNLNNSEDHILKKDGENNGSLSALSDTGHLQQHPHSSHGVT